jgi:hypothetical protein
VSLLLFARFVVLPAGLKGILAFRPLCFFDRPGMYRIEMIAVFHTISNSTPEYRLIAKSRMPA